MSREIIGNSYTYIVDESYGTNNDGFIAIGTESIVYKGLKTKHGGGLQFSCVLKFKPKRQIIDGKIVDNLAHFKEVEWPIFRELRECRSVVRIDDVIDDLGDFSLPCRHISGGVIDSSTFFCVVEEFVDGWNLDEFCREEFWRLRRTVHLPNGLQEKIEFNKFSEDDKKEVLESYTYENQLKYQNQIMLFMLNLCEIMAYVTEQRKILHLDIKPENIMVTRYGKELVLIDFGRSKRVTDANRFAINELTAVDYSKPESQDKEYQYGTLGYAAPECFCESLDGSEPPVGAVSERGKMSIESDIFSFGATFWECLHMFELATTNKEDTLDLYDFYYKNMLRKDAYCDRDLTLTNTTYQMRLDKIIKKCTKARTDDFRDSDKKFYRSYQDLKKDIEAAMDSTPTIVKEENVKVRMSFKFMSVFLGICFVLLFINQFYNGRAFEIAENKWNNLTESYNETQFARLSTVARDYLDAAGQDEMDGVYDKIEAFTYEDGGSVTGYEAALLVELLEQVGNDGLLAAHIDTIMINAEPSNFKDISTELVSLEFSGESVGYELAKAIYNVEVTNSNIVDAYDTLMKYKDNGDFHNAVVKLKNTLDNDKSIALIEADKNKTRDEIIDTFNAIKGKEAQK